MNWGTTILLTFLLLAAGLPWHLPDALAPERKGAYLSRLTVLLSAPPLSSGDALE